MRAWHVAAALLLPLVVLAQPAVEQELTRLEEERIELFRTGKGDWAKFYVEDYIGIFDDGSVRDLAQTKAQKRDPAYAVSDVQLYLYGNAALMTGVQMTPR